MRACSALGGRSLDLRHAIRADTTQADIIMCKRTASHHMVYTVSPREARATYIERSSQTNCALVCAKWRADMAAISVLCINGLQIYLPNAFFLMQITSVRRT